MFVLLLRTRRIRDLCVSQGRAEETTPFPNRETRVQKWKSDKIYVLTLRPDVGLGQDPMEAPNLAGGKRIYGVGRPTYNCHLDIN